MAALSGLNRSKSKCRGFDLEGSCLGLKGHDCRSLGFWVVQRPVGLLLCGV